MVWSTSKLQELALIVTICEVTELWDKHRTKIEYNLPFWSPSTSSTADYFSKFQVPSSWNFQLSPTLLLTEGILQSIYSF